MVIIICALSTAIYAGPEALPSGKEIKEIAPAPPACPSWAGFYVGIAGGYKFAPVDIDLRLIDEWEFFRSEGDIIQSKGSGDFLDTSGAELGGLIGYNFQLNNWVLGLETSGAYLWLRDFEDSGPFLIDFPGFYTTDYSVRTAFRTHYNATFGGRIGYALCRWMPYVTGGGAMGDVDFEQRVIQHGPPFHQGGRHSDTNLGWMIGGGLEYALNNHWRLRLQYQYADLGSEDFEHSTTDPDFFGNTEIDLREHNVSFGIIYRF